MWVIVERGMNEAFDECRVVGAAVSADSTLVTMTGRDTIEKYSAVASLIFAGTSLLSVGKKASTPKHCEEFLLGGETPAAQGCETS